MTLAATLDTRAKALKDLQRIPGIGPSLARDLLSLGISCVAQLRGKKPERLYTRLEKQTGASIDRCVLYTFRCAVYYAETDRPNSKLLKWWNWKDTAKPAHSSRGRARGVRRVSPSR